MDLTRVGADEILRRDVKAYDAGGGQTLRIAQVETVGRGLGGRRDELMQALEALREREGDALAALMVTDIIGKGTELYVSGDRAAVGRAFGARVEDGIIDLPGVMSRKKQVAPQLLAALGPQELEGARDDPGVEPRVLEARAGSDRQLERGTGIGVRALRQRRHGAHRPAGRPPSQHDAVGRHRAADGERANRTERDRPAADRDRHRRPPRRSAAADADRPQLGSCTTTENAPWPRRRRTARTRRCRAR